MNENKDTKIYLEGTISVTAAIKAGKREIKNVFIDRAKYEKRDRKTTHLISVLKKSSIPYSLCDRSDIDSLADSSSHGGVIAETGEMAYLTVAQLINSLKDNEYAVMLDGIEDPYNFGYSIRNLFAFGCKGFIIPQRNWMSASNVVSTASAGASELCDIAVSQSDEVLINALKMADIDIVCAAVSQSSVSLYDFKPKKPFLLFIGGEKRGISKAFIENADTIVHIPYNNDDARYSLPAASCAAIFGSYLSTLN